MASRNRKKLYRTALLSGTVSIVSYLLLYTHQGWVTRNFTRGGAYAVLPIATAFYFSFVHGTFSSCLLDLFGFRVAAGVGAGKGQPADSPKGEELP